MSFLAPSSSEARRSRFIIGGLSALATLVIMTGFLVESRWGYSRPDDRIIMFESWKGDRTRADTIADMKATKAAREAKLAQAQAYIATLSGEKRKAAQKQYDAYVDGGGPRKDLPYVAADEPPVE